MKDQPEQNEHLDAVIDAAGGPDKVWVADPAKLGDATYARGLAEQMRAAAGLPEYVHQPTPAPEVARQLREAAWYIERNGFTADMTEPDFDVDPARWRVGIRGALNLATTGEPTVLSPASIDASEAIAKHLGIRTVDLWVQPATGEEAIRALYACADKLDEAHRNALIAKARESGRDNGSGAST